MLLDKVTFFLVHSLVCVVTFLHNGSVFFIACLKFAEVYRELESMIIRSSLFKTPLAIDQEIGT